MERQSLHLTEEAMGLSSKELVQQVILWLPVSLTIKAWQLQGRPFSACSHDQAAVPYKILATSRAQGFPLLHIQKKALVRQRNLGFLSPRSLPFLITQKDGAGGRSGCADQEAAGCARIVVGWWHFCDLVLAMDHRYEDVSDCEVDHSFFDSDFEEEVKKVETTPKTDAKETCELAEIDTTESKTDLKMETKVLENDCSEGRTQEEEMGFQDKHAFSSGAYQPEKAIFLSVNSESANTSGSNSTQSEIMPENSFASQVPQIVKHCEENYYTDEENSSDDSRNQLVRHKLSKQANSAKCSKNKTVHPSSSTSSSPSSSSDTDCSDTDSDGCLSDSSCSLKKKSTGSLATCSSKQRSSPGTKLVELKSKLNNYAEESEDTVTDVTPLSTPDISPIQSFELSASSDKLKVKRQENVSQEIYEPDLDHKCQQKVLHEAVDLNHLLKAFLQLEKKEQQKMVLDQSPINSRKNYSFTNDEVRQIDQENQRLLKELTKHSSKPRSKSASLKKPSGPAPKMYHSAINRQREQQRIDRENLAFLKRLEAVKPSAGMRRSEQLMDYQRQMSYLNAAPTPRRGKSALSHHSPSRGASRASSHSASSTVSRRSERPVFDSSSGALQRLNPSNIRDAWL